MQKISNTPHKKLYLFNRIHSLGLSHPVHYSSSFIIFLTFVTYLQQLAAVLKATIAIDSSLETSRLYYSLAKTTNVLLLNNFIDVKSDSSANIVSLGLFIGYSLILLLSICELVNFLYNRNAEMLSPFKVKVIKLLSLFHCSFFFVPSLVICYNIIFQVANYGNGLVSGAICIISLIFAILQLVVSILMLLMPLIWTTNLKHKFEKLSLTSLHEIYASNVHKVVIAILNVTCEQLIKDEKSYLQLLWGSIIINLLLVLIINNLHYFKPCFYSNKLRNIQKFFYGLINCISLLNLGYLAAQSSKTTQEKSRSLLQDNILLNLVLIPIFIKLSFSIEKIMEKQDSIEAAKSTTTSLKYSKNRNLLLIHKLSKLTSNENRPDVDLRKFKEKLLLGTGLILSQSTLTDSQVQTTRKTTQKPSVILNYPYSSQPSKLQQKSNNNNTSHSHTATTHHRSTTHSSRSALKKIFFMFKQRSRKDIDIQVSVANVIVSQFEDIIESYRLISPILESKSQDMSHQTYLGALQVRDQIQALIDRKKQENSVSLEIFMRAMDNYNKLDGLIGKQIELRKQFYNLLLAERPCFSTMTEISFQLRKQQGKTTKFWATVTDKQQQEYTPMLKMYGLYHLFVNHQLDEGTALLQKYNNFEFQGFQDQRFMNNKATYLTHSVVCLISAQPRNIGTVISCSVNCQKYLGVPVDSIIGKNINTIMPNSIAKVHDNLLKSQLEKSDTGFLTARNIQGFSVSKAGYLISIDILTTLYPSVSEGLMYWGMIRPNDARLEYMIVSKRGLIEAATEKISNKLRIDVKSLLTQGTHIGNVCQKNPIDVIASKTDFSNTSQSK